MGQPSGVFRGERNLGSLHDQSGYPKLLGPDSERGKVDIDMLRIR